MMEVSAGRIRCPLGSLVGRLGVFLASLWGFVCRRVTTNHGPNSNDEFVSNGIVVD